jgi:hypothetical protein
MSASPYRKLPPRERSSVSATFHWQWRDAEERTNPAKVIAALSFGAAAAGIFATVNPGFGLATLVGAVGWAIWNAREKGERSGITLGVDAGDLLLIDKQAVLPRRVALTKVREVEMESKAIRRVTYGQQVGEAIPSTHVSGDVDVARIVLVIDGDAQPVRLTDSYESYSNCAECFGKVRVFLRAHGWLPEREREG